MKRLDENIKKDIVDELYWDNRIDASQVNVTVNDGIVTLSGSVPTYSDLAIAKIAASRINGVFDVIDKLTVEYTSPPTLPSDMEIKSRAEDILTWDPVIDDSAITITVSAGLVTIEGTVDALWKKSTIENKLAGIHGILKIENKLAVVPTQRISDENIAKDVVSALDRDILVDAENVTVKVDDSVVKLSGNVPSWASKHAAEVDASLTSGVMDVKNELDVNA